jgi:hypothetical protein
MPTARADSATIDTGASFWAGRDGVPTVSGSFEVVADGAWTWCDTIINAMERNGALYVQVVDSAGTNRIHKRTLSSGVTQSFQLGTTGLEIDDHNAHSFNFDPSGRIVSFYGLHNDPIFRSRRSINPEDITSWTGESQRGTGSGPYAYHHLTRLSQMPSRLWYLCRRWIDGSGTTRTCAVRTSDTIDALSDANYPGTNPWSNYTDIWRYDGHIPYWQIADDGVNRIHLCAIDRHPVQGQNSLYHFYMQLDGSNNMRWYQTNGTEITAPLPLGPANATLVYDGSAERCWAYDLALDSNGFPRILYCVYPGNASHGAPIEYWHARWDGSSWINSYITEDGPGLYIPEIYYAGALSFDRSDVSKICLSAPISGVRQIQEWQTSNNGLTWSMSRQITSGGSVGSPLKFRPIYVRNRSVGPRWLWLEGTYITFSNYNLKVMASY